MHRLISDSEVSALLDCQAKHDFRYVGQLAGSALAPKSVVPLLSQGKAWGRAVAAFHSADPQLSLQPLHDRVVEALRASIDEDAKKQLEAGLYVPEDRVAMEERLTEILSHYVATAERLPIDRLEHELIVPIPSRTGQRKSNRYKLQVRFDGIHVDGEGRTWIVEFKLRGQLSPLEQITLSRQTRWYAWAWREATGVEPTGVIVDERLNEPPKPPKIVQSKSGVGREVEVPVLDKETKEPTGKTKVVWKAPSTDKQQLTTVPLYEAACNEYGVDPDPEMVEALAARRWQLREPIFFRDDELDEAGLQLVSVAQQLQGFDSGDLYPVRNPWQARCGGCQFREICPTPNDNELVNALFKRAPAKKDREPTHAP